MKLENVQATGACSTSGFTFKNSEHGESEYMGVLTIRFLGKKYTITRTIVKAGVIAINNGIWKILPYSPSTWTISSEFTAQNSILPKFSMDGDIFLFRSDAYVAKKWPEVIKARYEKLLASAVQELSDAD